MTAWLGDEIMIIPRDSREPVREGHIREVRHDLGGVVYLVQWLDTGHESLLPHGPNVVIKHQRPGGPEQATAEETPWLSRLRHPLDWRHTRDLERRHLAAYERLAARVQEIIAGLGLIQEDFSIGGGRYHVHTTHVDDREEEFATSMVTFDGSRPSNCSPTTIPERSTTMNRNESVPACPVTATAGTSA